MQQEKRREAVGVFNDLKNLDEAVAELETTAFPRHDISVLGAEKGTDENAVMTAARENNPDSPRGISIRPEEKAIGAGVLIGCCAYIAGCAVAIAVKSSSSIVMLSAITGGSVAGAAFGAIIVLIISHSLKTKVERQIRRGGLVLWVRIPDAAKDKLALDIMRKHGGKHVHINRVA